VNGAVVDLGARLRVAILNTHVPILRPETLLRRRQVRQALRQRTRAHAAGAWVADTNSRSNWPTIARGEQSVTEAGIDKAKAWGPSGLVVTERRTVNLTIDGHDAHGARVIWRR
jgi:hypothetical protein